MTNVVPFSTFLRERSSGAHSDSEGAGFMSDLISGAGTREDYVALVAQHYFIYEALEAATDRMRRDPVAAPFVTDRLTRLPSLQADLEFLIGDDWREHIEPLGTTVRYVDRIRTVAATWPGGFVAHHYTRYLGDLSGGLFIGKVMGRRFGLKQDGIRFYLFADIADPQGFKQEYREQLDAGPWDAEERERIVDEVLVAYRLNTELFEDLAHAKAAAVA